MLDFKNITMVNQLTAERDNLQEVLVQANNTISEYTQLLQLPTEYD